MADSKKETEADKPAVKAKAKPNFLENKAVVLGAIVVAQAVVAIGLTQFVIVPKLGVGAADAGSPLAGATGHGEKSEVKGGGEKKNEKKSEKTPAHGGAEAASGLEGMGTLADLQEIVVTLAGDSARPRYLRLSVSLEVSDEGVAGLVEARRPQLRDSVIMALSDKTAAMLGTPEGKKRLRDEIHRRVAGMLPEGALLNVYFSDLVVQ